MTISDPFTLVAALAKHLEVRNITDLPGCWEEQVDDTWWFAVNAHLTDVECSHGATVPPGALYVEYNGWPAGIVHISGDGEFAAGEGANPETFAQAVADRIGRNQIAEATS